MSWAKAVKDIRRLDGFEDFLLPPSYDKLKIAADNGPVILINITDLRCDAIIARRLDEPILVPLPGATSISIQDLVGRFGIEMENSELEDSLRELWRIVVEPVVAVLRAEDLGLIAGSRIWWCPTGIAAGLPLHAAGPYVPGEPNLSQIFLSSYSPTLGSLIRARGTETATRGAPNKVNGMMIVRHSPADKGSTSTVPMMVDAIQQYAPDSVLLGGAAATRDTILNILNQHAWLHLSCEVKLDSSNAHLPHLLLHDGPLPLVDVIQQHLSRAEFAFLSGLQSSWGSSRIQGASLHPSEGMLLSGYRSVVGIPSRLDEGSASALVDKFYRVMIGAKSASPDSTRAAAALGRALEELEGLGITISLRDRLDIVHFGI